MIGVPLPVEHYLKPLLGAARSAGFIGIVFILARAAEAPTHHLEFASNWASLHDVSGPLIGVLAPSTTGELKDSVVPGGRGGRAAGIKGFEFAYDGSSDAGYRLSSAFWALAIQDPQVSRCIKQAPDVSLVNEYPLPAADLADAWTKAATQSAQYFGISEEKLPCMLVISLQEQTSLIVRLRPNLSIYALLKATKVALGPGPSRITELRKQQSQLSEKLLPVRERDERLRQKGIERIQAMQNSIKASPWLDSELRAFCQEALRRAFESGDPCDAPTALKQLYTQIGDTQRRHGVRRANVQSLMKLLADSNEAQSEVKQLESELEGSLADEATTRASLDLAGAMLAAYEQTFAKPKIESVPGEGALEGWTVQHVDLADAPPVRLAKVRT